MEKREVERGDRGIEKRGVGGGRRGRHILGVGQYVSQRVGRSVGNVFTGDRGGMGTSRVNVTRSRAGGFRIGGRKVSRWTKTVQGGLDRRTVQTGILTGLHRNRVWSSTVDDVGVG